MQKDHELGDRTGLTQTHPYTRPQDRAEYSRPMVLAAVLVVFAVFYPYLDAAGLCGDAGCPHFVQSNAPASADLPSATLAAVAVTASPAPARTFYLLPTSDRRPAEVYAAPEPEPPRP